MCQKLITFTEELINRSTSSIAVEVELVVVIVIATAVYFCEKLTA
jgi:hypothetical protein